MEKVEASGGDTKLFKNIRVEKVAWKQNCLICNCCKWQVPVGVLQQVLTLLQEEGSFMAGPAFHILKTI